MAVRQAAVVVHAVSPDRVFVMRKPDGGTLTGLTKRNTDRIDKYY